MNFITVKEVRSRFYNEGIVRTTRTIITWSKNLFPNLRKIGRQYYLTEDQFKKLFNQMTKTVIIANNNPPDVDMSFAERRAMEIYNSIKRS